jgi:hypothetical protein
MGTLMKVGLELLDLSSTASAPQRLLARLDPIGRLRLISIFQRKAGSSLLILKWICSMMPAFLLTFEPTVGGLLLSKILKNMTNMFPKYKICTGTFGHGTKLYMI